VGVSKDVISVSGGAGGVGGPGGPGGSGFNESSTIALLPGVTLNTQALPPSIRTQFEQATTSLKGVGSDTSLAIATLGKSLSGLLTSLPSRNRTLPDAIRNQFEQVSTTIGSTGAGSQKVLSSLTESLGGVVSSLPREDRPLLSSIKSHFEQVSSSISSNKSGSNLALSIAAKILGLGGSTSGRTSSIGSAAKGALLDHDQLISAHANELILPANISSGMRMLLSSQ